MVSREDINSFLDEVAIALQHKPTNDIPSVEASRKVIEHYNRGRMQGVEEVGYFIFSGVKVFEKGKRESSEARDNRTMEEVNFGAK